MPGTFRTQSVAEQRAAARAQQDQELEQASAPRRVFAVIDWERAAHSSEDSELGVLPTLLEDEEGANLVTSLMDQDGPLPVHMPALDIDLPARLVPSSTPGHFHLFLDHAMSQDAYWALLDALATAGIVEEGWVRSAKHRGYTALRHNCTKDQEVRYR